MSRSAEGDSALTSRLMEILVCPLSSVHAAIAEVRAAHLISLLSPAEMISTPDGISAGCHLKVEVNDIAAPAEDLVAPAEAHARSVIEFAQAWDRRRPIVIHCWAGISRSTAAAFLVLCALRPAADEVELAGLLRLAAPFASPNRLLVRHGDAVLGRRGRMIAAVDAMGDPILAWEGRPFRIPVAVSDAVK